MDNQEALLPDICPRCKCCETEWQDCYNCGGEGYLEGNEEDPLWYDPGDLIRCDICRGNGGWRQCVGDCDGNGKHETKAATA